MADPRILGADLLMRIGVDASGVDTEIASRLTRAERAAVASGDRIAAGVSRGADKATAAQLRVVAATERYNAVLQRGSATQGQIASAQASLITARRTAAKEADRESVAVARLNRESTGLSRTVGAFVGASAGFAAFSFLRGGVDEVKDFQAGLAQARAGIRSTGGVANVSARDIENLAGSLQGVSGTEDDLIVQGENLILTFRNVRNEVGQGNAIFDRATKASLDLSVRGFGSMETTSKTLGKALNDPVRGMTALSRAGVTFSDSQKATIRSLVESGQLLEAQKVILREVETQVGGSARAYGKTLPGELDKAHRALEDFEQGTLETVAPALRGLARVATFFSDHKTAREAALWAGGITAAVFAASKVIKAYQTVGDVVLRSIGPRIAANLGLAASYDRIAVSAGRAATAEGAEAAAGSAGRGLGGRAATLGLAGRTGPIGLGIAAVGGLLFADEKTTDSRQSALADKIATPQQLAAAKARLREIESLARRDNGRPDLLSEHNDLVAVIAQATPRVKRAAKQVGVEAGKAFSEGVKASQAAQAFAAHPLFTGTGRADNIASARTALADAIQARNEANRALSQARAQGVGGEGASAQDIRIAELRLQSARDNLGGKNGSTASERASVLSAERTLNDLRNKGKATAAETATAERGVAAAIRSQKDAQDRVNAARKALDEARGISAQEALRRVRADAKAQGTLRADVTSLVGKGATRGELSALKQLEESAPGTIHRIATTTGEKFQDDFATALRRIRRRTNAIEELFDGADTLAQRKGRQIAASLQKGIAEGLEGFDFRGYFSGDGAVVAPGSRTPHARPSTSRVLRASARQTGWPVL